MSGPPSQHVREQIAEHENARAVALRALDDLAARRRELLLGASDKAGDKALADHDASVQRERRNVERAEAHLAELRPTLERAEATEQAAAVADLARHGADLVDAYERIARDEYLPAARALAEILRRMDCVRYDVERVAAGLPSGSHRLQVEGWRRQVDSNWRLPSLPESVKLPALRQGDRAIWDGEHRRPTVQREMSAPVAQAQPVWNPPPISVTRPNEQAELRRIHERADAEGRGRIPSLADIGRAPNP